MLPERHEMKALQSEAIACLGNNRARFERVHEVLEPSFVLRIRAALSKDENLKKDQPINVLITEAIGELKKVKARYGLEFLRGVTGKNLRTVAAASIQQSVYQQYEIILSDGASQLQSGLHGERHSLGSNQQGSLR